MAQYVVHNLLATTPALQSVSSTYKTMIELLAATTGLKRNKWYGYAVGLPGAPAASDTYFEFDIVRITATGTGTASTPNPIDGADSACSATAKINDSAEPTVTANSGLDYVSANQRATITWQTNDDKQMLVGPATNANGLALRLRSGGYTTNAGTRVWFNE